MNKAFNNQVNRSINSDQVFKAWKSYREAIMSFIGQRTGRILVVGAGNCFDLDLKAFKDSQLTLLDIDEAAMIAGMARQDVVFQTISMDLTGLPESFYHGFKEAVNGNRLEAYIEDLTPDFDYELEDYDCIIVMPIYTQLILPLVLDLVISNQANLELTMQFIGALIQMINNKLISHTKEIIVFSDLIEYERDSEEGRYLNHHQDHKIILETHVIDYLSQYGHGLGSFGQADLMKNMATISDYFVWPFDENRIILVKGEKGKL